MSAGKPTVVVLVVVVVVVVVVVASCGAVYADMGYYHDDHVLGRSGIGMIDGQVLR